MDKGCSEKTLHSFGLWFLPLYFMIYFLKLQILQNLQFLQILPLFLKFYNGQGLLGFI